MPPQDPQDPEGKIVQDIRVEPADTPSAGRILNHLAARRGQPFRGAVIRQAIRELWSEYKVRTEVFTEVLPNGEVRIIVEVAQDYRAYQKVLFKGNSAKTESQLRALLGPGITQTTTDFAALGLARAIEASYRRDGYYYCRVGIETDDTASTLTFRIDEGPKVTVREVVFRGNESVPTRAPIGLYRNLLSSSGIESQPAGALLPGAVFSEETVEEDLNKLRAFYRGIGYRDAEVELVRITPSHDLETVDLTFRVIEGPRYRVSAVEIEQVGPEGVTDYQPLVPVEQLRAELRLKPGDFYDRDRLSLDQRALKRFYGKRGHPPQGEYGPALRDALIVDEPRETFDFDAHEIKLVWRIREGTPKKLHDVRIRGNTHTEDRVVRRKVFLFPGEILDMDKVERSLASLEALRYFGDESGFGGVQFELLPVEGRPDEVDLVIEVKEGDTGQLIWGAGVSTGAGLVASVRFTKRNFDLTSLPSSWNPGTILDEIVRGEAFHGAGQELDMLLAPGTEISTFRVSWFDPDIFRRHFDTIGMRVQGYRTLRRLDGYNTDELGGALSLSRQFTEQLGVNLTFRDSTFDVTDIDPNAPAIVWDAEGKSELRSLGMQVRWRNLDQPLRPTEGLQTTFEAEYGGGFLGAQVDMLKLHVDADNFWAFYRDARDRAHVLRTRVSFDYGQNHDTDEPLFLAERFMMGGMNLRGFEQRGAGPKQFGTPVGGEAMFLAGVEYNFPIVSTRTERALRETEILRGVVFADYGHLGLQIDDPTFRDPRLSVGFGVRIFVPVLQVPIALDLAWPLLYEETDERRQLFFTLSR